MKVRAIALNTFAGFPAQQTDRSVSCRLRRHSAAVSDAAVGDEAMSGPAAAQIGVASAHLGGRADDDDQRIRQPSGGLVGRRYGGDEMKSGTILAVMAGRAPLGILAR